MLDSFRARMRSVLRRDAVATEMEEELRQHLDESTELLIRRGMSPDEARRVARQEMGNRTVIVEDARAARGTLAIDDIRRDVQLAVRALARTPWFTVVVIITLALGFGVNGAIFAVLKGAMTPKSIADAGTWLNIPDHWSWEEFQRLGRGTRTMTEWSASANEIVVLGSDARGAEPRTVRAQFVTEGFLPSLRGRATLGRIFSRADVEPPIGMPVAILSHSFWRRRFHSDSSIIGRDIRLADGQPFEVIGVMPEGFTGLSLDYQSDLWLPLGTRARLPDTDDARGGAVRNWFDPSGRRFLTIHARLAPDASLSAARAELRLRIEQVSSPVDSTRGRAVARYTFPATRLPINGADDMAFLGVVLGAAISVLLIASVTVANLMLARAASRRREMGVRLALGASRGRVLRTWMTECFVLSIMAAVVGIVFASWTVRTILLGPTFSAMLRDGDPLVYVAALAPDVSVFVYLVLLSIPSTLVFGLVPALRATRHDPLTTMRGGAGSTGSTASVERVFLRRGLVVSQVALTMVLLLTSVMMVRGVQVMSRVDPGFNRDEVIAVSPKLVLSGYDSVRADGFVEEFLGRLSSVPGVQQVTRGSVPMQEPTHAYIKRADEVTSGETGRNGNLNAVTETFFDVLGIEIVRGRTFSRMEVLNGVPVAVISESTAETLWPDEEAIGKVISATSLDEHARKELRDGTFAQARVIGVARDAQMSGFGIYPRRYVYVPGDHATLMLRTNGDPEVATRVRALTRLIDPNVIVDVRTLDQAVLTSSGWVESAKLVANSAAATGILSLLMALVGLFGLTAYMVEQRTREFGVRMALGASVTSVLRLVAGQSLRLVAIGATIGIVAGIGMAGLLRSAMYGLRNTPPFVHVLIVLLLAVVSILACGIPAWRATRVDPMIALRTD